MYIALTEEQAAQIRSSGIQVIQFKKMVKNVNHFFMYTIPELIRMCIKAIKSFCDLCNQVIDDIRLAINSIRNSCGCKTTGRYAFVKAMSNLGYDKRDIWRATRHTWLARSNC